MQRDGNPPLRRGQHGEARRLSRSQDGVAVVLGEDALDGDRIRREAFQLLGQTVVDRQKTQILGYMRIGSDDIHVDKGKPAGTAGLHDADPAAGEARVDAKNDHEDQSSCASWAITSSEAVQLL